MKMTTKLQTNFFTKEVLNQLQEKSQVILSRIDSSEWQRPRHEEISDIPDVASYVECTSCEFNTMPKTHKLSKTRQSLSKKNSRKSLKNRDQLIRIFGSLLEEIELRPAQKLKDRKHSLPVSINIPNEDFLIPLKVKKFATVSELPAVEFTCLTKLIPDKIDFQFISSTIALGATSVARAMPDPQISSQMEVVKNKTTIEENSSGEKTCPNLSIPSPTEVALGVNITPISPKPVQQVPTAPVMEKPASKNPSIFQEIMKELRMSKTIDNYTVSPSGGGLVPINQQSLSVQKNPNQARAIKRPMQPPPTASSSFQQLQRMSQIQSFNVFSNQKQNQTCNPPAPKLLRLSYSMENEYNLISNADFAKRIFPHLNLFIKWRENACKYCQNMCTFLDQKTFKEDYDSFNVYARYIMRTFGKKMLRDLLSVDVEQFSLNEIFAVLNRKLLEKSIDMKMYRICMHLHSMLKECEEFCATPLTKKFFNHIKIAMEKMEMKSLQGSSLFQPAQRRLLESQIKQFLSIQNWLNRIMYRNAQMNQVPRLPNQTQLELRNILSRPLPAATVPERSTIVSLTVQRPTIPYLFHASSTVPPGINQVPPDSSLTVEHTTTMPRHDNIKSTGTISASPATNQVPSSTPPNSRTTYSVALECITPPLPRNDNIRSNGTTPLVSTPVLDTNELSPVQSTSMPINDNVESTTVSPAPPNQVPVDNASPVQSVIVTKEEIKKIDCFNSNEVIDLTWMDDDEAEIIEEINSNREFVSAVENDASSRESVSPADSGLGSPTSQSDSKDDYRCLCGNKAIYVCACKLSMYCSRTCQISDWPDHQKWCKKQT